MRPTTSFALTDHQRSFAKRKVAEGRFASVSDVVRASMRLLEEHEAKLDRLKAEIIRGVESGPAAPFDVEEFLRERHRK